MEAAGDQFLAGAGLAQDQHVGGGVRDLEDDPADLLDRGGLAEHHRLDALAVGQLPPQGLDLQRQAAPLQRPLDRADQTVGGEGFFDEVVGADPHRLDRHGDVAMAGHQDDRQLGIDPHGLLQQGQPIHPRQPDIGHDDAGELRMEQVADRLGDTEAPGFDAGDLEGLYAGGPDGIVVLDQQHAQTVRHSFTPQAVSGSDFASPEAAGQVS